MNDRFNFRRIVASVLILIAFIMIVAECNDNMVLFIMTKIVGAIIGYVGYIIMLDELREEVE